MKLFIFALCLAVLSVFSAFGATANARCGKVYVPGHYHHHHWVPAHYVHRHWVPAHRDYHGRFIPGHCE